MKEYVFKPGDKVIWLKTISRKKPFKEIPATFIKYSGINVVIRPDRLLPEDLLQKTVNVMKERIYLAGVNNV